MTSTKQPKPFEAITKGMVWRAYKAVKANGGAGGVDGKSIEDFESDLENNLYKIFDSPLHSRPMSSESENLISRANTLSNKVCYR